MKAKAKEVFMQAADEAIYFEDEETPIFGNEEGMKHSGAITSRPETSRIWKPRPRKVTLDPSKDLRMRRTGFER